MDAEKHTSLTKVIDRRTVGMALGYAKAAGFPQYEVLFQQMVINPFLMQAIAEGIIKVVMLGGPEEVERMSQWVKDTEGQLPS